MKLSAILGYLLWERDSMSDDIQLINGQPVGAPPPADAAALINGQVVDVQVDAPVEAPVDAPVEAAAPVAETPPASLAQNAAPRTLAAVEADLLQAFDDVEGMVADEAQLVEAYVKANWDKLKAEALADWAAVKAEKTAIVQTLADELHAAHDWLASKISAIL